MNMSLARSLAALAAAFLMTAGVVEAEEPSSQVTDPAVARGAYLALAGDCAACHTAPSGKAFAGGLGLATPLGTIVATNITPSKTHGIGNYSLEQFAKAVRDGVREDGAHLYPAMPYTAYAGITDADIADLYAYFTQAVVPVDEAPQPTALPFPFNIRASMAGWNLLFLDRSRFSADPSHDEQWNRGAYLANVLAHCGTCHTPRNFLMAEDRGRLFAGASLGSWYAPNITSDGRAGIGGWNASHIAAYLQTGRSGNGAEAAGPMQEAIDKSLHALTPQDLAALSVYLKTVPAHPDGLPPSAAGPGNPIASDIALLSSPAAGMEGPHLYDAYCAACHQMSGQGTAGGGLPSLIGNSAIDRGNPDNLVMAILDGVWPEQGQAMPGFRRLLSDQQVADLANFLFAQFGSSPVRTDAAHVASLRSGGKASSLPVLARTLLAVGGLVALVVLGGLVRVLRRRRSAA